ncbi:MAG: hypothetical protein ACYCX9_02070 [Candidatus Dormibacteria bacterium]
MAKHRFRTGLALIGGCAAISILVPPLAGLLNVVASITMLGLAAYAAYRSWAFMESLVEASRRPATVRRNLESQRQRTPERDREAPELDEPTRDGDQGPSSRTRRLRLPALRREGAFRDR